MQETSVTVVLEIDVHTPWTGDVMQLSNNIENWIEDVFKEVDPDGIGVKDVFVEEIKIKAVRGLYHA